MPGMRKYTVFIYISVIIPLLFLKSSIHAVETYLEGSMSQNCNVGLSFSFIVCRSFAKITKVTRFLLQNKN